MSACEFEYVCLLGWAVGLEQALESFRLACKYELECSAEVQLYQALCLAGNSSSLGPPFETIYNYLWQGYLYNNILNNRILTQTWYITLLQVWRGSLGIIDNNVQTLGINKNGRYDKCNDENLSCGKYIYICVLINICWVISKELYMSKVKCLKRCDNYSWWASNNWWA